MSAVSIILALTLFSSVPDYAALKEGAMTIDRPATAIAALIGACDQGDPGFRAECEQNVRGLKEKVSSRRIALDLGANHEAFLTFAKLDGDSVRFVWTPIYDVGNGFALTVEKPQKLSPTGNIVVPRRPVDGKTGSDVRASDLDRAARLGQIGIEIVGKFGKPWQLRGGENPVRGITFELEGIRLYHARTGKTVLESAPQKGR